jgi:hypothetical protein
MDLKFLLLAFVIILPFAGKSQKSQINGTSSLSNIRKGVCLITFNDNTKPGTISCGTGTIVDSIKIVPAESLAITRSFLVTNNHVLPKVSQSRSITIRISDDSNQSGYQNIEVPVYDSSGNYLDNVRLDPDGNDLAIINLTPIIITRPELKNIILKGFSFSQLATDEVLEEHQIDIGDDIFFIGYPTFLFDKRNISPILRRGAISTSPKNDFFFSDEYRLGFKQQFGQILSDKLSGFLIDATALGGSSGSLVITKPFYTGPFEYIQRTTSTGQIYILGILTYSYPELASGLKANIGGVISAKQIRKTISLFTNK